MILDPQAAQNLQNMQGPAYQMLVSDTPPPVAPRPALPAQPAAPSAPTGTGIVGMPQPNAQPNDNDLFQMLRTRINNPAFMQQLKQLLGAQK